MTAADLRVIQRRGTLALGSREVYRVLSLWTQTIVPHVVTAALLLAVFAAALDSRAREIEGLDYLSFMLPGLLVLTTVSAAVTNASTSLYQAKSEGYIEDVLTSPLRPWQIVAGYAAGSVVRAWVSAGLVALVAAPFTIGVAHPLGAVAALALAGFVFASLGVIVGIAAESFDEHAFVANLVVTPLALLAGVFYSARDLGEPWETLTRLDPLYYLVDATRYGFTGHNDAPIAISLGVTAAVGIALFGLAVALVGRGWRLKP
jgi:ABC-2 type transport system permease protein